MKINLLVVFAFLAIATPSIGSTSITKNDITWQFSSDQTVGQFVTGDYWVLDSGPGVVIASITPTPSATANGTMVNPVVDGPQCLDSRASAYSLSACASLPLTVHGGDVVLSSISVGGAITTDWAGGGIDSHTFVAAAEILTVVSAAPPVGSFRPAYVDRSQTLYNVSSLDLSKLPNLTATASLPHPISYYERGMARPWLQFLYNFTSRSIHAAQNMYEYHREISTFLSEFTAIMMSNTPGKDTAINNFIQIGIDQYHIGKLGVGDSAYYVAPALFAGILLGDSGMQNLFTDGSLKAVPRDYPDFYYWKDHQSTIKSKIVPEGQTWTGATVFFRNQIGNGEHEHLHPSEWGIPSNMEHWKNDAYRKGIDSWTQVGMVLAARLLGHDAVSLWGHPATFDYIDRWMSEDHNAECIILEQYDDSTSYGVSCPPSIPRGGAVFIDSMWDTYRGAPLPPTGDAKRFLPFKTNGKATKAPQ